MRGFQKLALFVSALLPFASGLPQAIKTPIADPEPSEVIPNQYIITLKDTITNLDSHLTWVHRIHARSLGRRELGLAGVEETYNIPNFKGYAGAFDNDIIAEIKANPQVRRPTDNSTYALLLKFENKHLDIVSIAKAIYRLRPSSRTCSFTLLLSPRSQKYPLGACLPSPARRAAMARLAGALIPSMTGPAMARLPIFLTLASTRDIRNLASALSTNTTSLLTTRESTRSPICPVTAPTLQASLQVQPTELLRMRRSSPSKSFQTQIDCNLISRFFPQFPSSFRAMSGLLRISLKTSAQTSL